MSQREDAIRQMEKELEDLRASEAFWIKQPPIFMASGPMQGVDYTARRLAEIRADIEETMAALRILRDEAT